MACETPGTCTTPNRLRRRRKGLGQGLQIAVVKLGHIGGQDHYAAACPQTAGADRGRHAFGGLHHPSNLKLQAPQDRMTRHIAGSQRHHDIGAKPKR